MLPAHSLATALVAAGMPAVIGWDGSVSDQAATVFAEYLYDSLARRTDLAEAVGDARRALLASADRWVRADWHLARLWLGPGGGGPLVAGNRRRPLQAAHGTRTFLAGKPEVPVAAADMFVGRRLELQRALRVLRERDKAGVLLRGQGRLGKSSLAARVADRLPDHAVAVVYGDYTALGVMDAVARAVRLDPAARQQAEAGIYRVRDSPGAIEQVLTDLLAGPCAQRGPGHQRPLLLVIDDLEQALVSDPAGPRRVDPGFSPVLAGVLRAFDPASTDTACCSPAGSRSPCPGWSSAWRTCNWPRCRRSPRPSCSAASRPRPQPSGRPSGLRWPAGRWRSAAATRACRT